MEVDTLRTLGQVAGIGGIALGIFLLLFRELIRKSIFPTLKKDDGYRLMKLLAVLVWSVALTGVGAWMWLENRPLSASRAEVGAGRDISARDIRVTQGSEPGAESPSVSAGRDIKARDIDVNQ